MQRVVDAVKIEGPVKVLSFKNQLPGSLQHPAIDFLEIGFRNGIGGGIEVKKITEREAKRVADFAVSLGKLRHDVVRHAHIGLIILRGDPQPQQIGAPFFAYLRRKHGVAE